MSDDSPLLARAAEVSKSALASGASQPARTRSETVEEAGVRFLVHVLVDDWGKTRPALECGDPGGASAPVEDEAGGEGKARTGVQGSQAAPVNPFLPYDRDLFVATLSTGHICLLNKYNVLPNHLLLVTPTFVEQETPLDLADFAAFWRCLTEFDGLAFYNSGPRAGASQRHKHLQVAPLPFDDGAPFLPVEAVLVNAQPDQQIACAPALPFSHVFMQLSLSWRTWAQEEAAHLLRAYHALLAAAGIVPVGERPAPHNLLLTRRWMMVVPRSRHAYAGIPVNSLGYAGSLLAKNEEQFHYLAAVGPLTVLRNTGVDRVAP